MAPTWRCSTPRRMGKCILRSSTRSRTSLAAPFAPWLPGAAGTLEGAAVAGSALIARLSLIDIPPAGGLVLGIDRQQRRVIHALGKHIRAAGGKWAALGGMEHIRGQALDADEPAIGAGIDARQRAEQTARVGVLGALVELVDRRALDHETGVH